MRVAGTKSSGDVAVLGKDSPGTDVLLLEGSLDGGEEETSGAEEGTHCQGGVDSILGLVFVGGGGGGGGVPSGVGRHFGLDLEGGGFAEGGGGRFIKVWVESLGISLCQLDAAAAAAAAGCELDFWEHGAWKGTCIEF